MSFDKNISKEDLESLEVVGYEGKITLIDEDSKVDEAVERLARYSVLGFDTETRPAFKKGVHYQTALLQLANAEEVFLFQLQKLENFNSLRWLLNNKKILKVGAAIRDDVKQLNLFFPVKRDSFVELQTLVKKYGIEDISLKKMGAITLGFRISKGQQVSNWEAEPLTEAQIRYAATDAWVPLLIYQKLMNNDK
ncbi:3'-5' exonuclease [Balneicella halophila]|uniref:3'-5' exonuclease n=1 Tax=Balneicella halophila TaxID=1537566 RepID=A0A7L4UR21_BALHA|nr:3'-5' exonuclease [Balneicella halophila]PVX51962.1 3'-5' exonuclease [Balneicella halophila]